LLMLFVTIMRPGEYIQPFSEDMKDDTEYFRA